MPAPPAAPDLEPLRSRRPGFVVTPADAAWDEARRAFDPAVEQRPACVARPANVEEIVDVVAFARERGLRVVPQCGGHNAGPLPVLGDAVLLRTGALDAVEIYPGARVARVEAGARWGAVCDAADRHGLAALAGSAREVGVVGHHLAGGVSFLGRAHGLAANSVTAIELVTAGERVVRCDRDHEPELFWALRGGGGLGVVTALEFALHPVPALSAGTFSFPLARAAEALHAWREWTLAMPDELTSCARLQRPPDRPQLPPPLRGQALATVGVVVLGDAARARELVAPIRALRPARDTFAAVSPAALGTFAAEPAAPQPSVAEHLLTGVLPAAAIDALLALAGPAAATRVATVELRHTGGALARGCPHGGALDRLPGEFLVHAAAPLADPAQAGAARAELRALRDALAPWHAGRNPGFTTVASAPEAFFDGATRRRLADAKRTWDPHDLFLANHPIQRR